MVCARPPFTGDNPVSIAYQHVREEPVPPGDINPDVPPVFASIVAKAMAKNRANRYSSAEDLRADLVRFNQGQAVTAEPVMAAPAAVAPAAAVTGVMARGTPVETTRIQQRVDGTRVVAPGETMVELDERPRARTSTYIVILAVLLAALGGLLFLLSRQLGVGGTQKVTVPLVIGKPEAEATKALTDAGLKVQRKEVQDDVNPAGQVTAQDPLANVEVNKGSTVALSISSGAPIVEVPDVRARTLDAASDILTTAGFRVTSNAVNSDKAPNTVLEQAPAAGDRKPKGSTITLTVSKGLEQIVVPPVRGRTASDAANLLGQTGFRTTTRTEASNDVEVGNVIRTEPAAGTPLDRNSTVTLVVSSGPTPTTVPLPVTTAPPVTTPLTTITIFPPTTTTRPPTSTSTTSTTKP
jgi:serine/threonine-protein kinase